MPEVYTIPLSKIIHELQLETAFLPKSADVSEAAGSDCCPRY